MRRFARSAIFVSLATTSLSCDPGLTPPDQALIDALTVRTLPFAPTQEAAKGTTALGLASPRDGWLFVPSTYNHAIRTPLAVLLHDANGSSADWETYKDLADGYGVVLLAIDSRYPTWDAIQTGDFGVDVDFLEKALEFTFTRVNVDPNRISIGGFVDGATEAISIGVANAGIFTRVLAHSPGLLMTPFKRGNPKILVSAGNFDSEVPMTTTRDNVVVGLRNQGFTVEFFLFDGGHTIPVDVRARAFEIMTAP